MSYLIGGENTVFDEERVNDGDDYVALTRQLLLLVIGVCELSDREE